MRVGLAVSDPDGMIATPVETLARGHVGRDAAGPPSDVRRIAAEVSERAARVVYVGLPRHLSGVEGAAAASVRAYAGDLARFVAPVPVMLVDERMSTVTAHQALHASGRAGRRHRAVVDQVAAVVILQSALDAERVGGKRAGERVAASDRLPGSGTVVDDVGGHEKGRRR
ncbi:putative holliday junction resolvase [mine drainage metagenome]|uniref:Putative holliday junction resolvase n=1 Tax=mine drainage metagenome TaxID=410659 RepID=A0A1J5QQ65_9ZZZZ